MQELSSEKPVPEEIEEEPPPPPPEPEPEPAEPPEPRDLDYERAWEEDYEEHIDGEDLPPPKPRKKKRKVGGIIFLLIVLIILLLWTMFSPKLLAEVGDTYITSPQYANLGNYTGTRDIWAGEIVWGVAFSGPDSTTVGATFTLSVLVTKVYEKPGNWFLKGTSITLKNVSFYDENDVCVGTMSDWTREPFGCLATVPVKLNEQGGIFLYAVIKFLVFVDMQIGFLPLETVEISQAYLSVPIIVS